jgi:hypothetical protein
MQQELLCYYGNATGCIDHVTKENLICHNMNLTQIGLKEVAWIHLARDRNFWRGLVITETNLYVP